ncbi:MAG: phosphotransferase, partial [Hamadaea sp.]|nr:phosphotransferase [Hamadaea sp.]
RTARRPGWADLPADLRAAIEERLGGAITSARVAGGGFTQGFAAVLTTAGGLRRFVKAAPLDSPPAEWYAQEARITAALPLGVPAARVRWTDELAGHFVICVDAVDGARMPALPWSTADLAATLDAIAATAAALSPLPPALAELATDAFSTAMKGTLDRWRAISDGERPLPDQAASLADRLSELVALETEFLALGDAATTVFHCDLRVDNVIIDTAGAAWICDWNWVTRGPAWTDLVTVLLSASPDHDVDRLFAAHPATRGLPDEALDAALAGLSGYFVTQATEPAVETSPYIRPHQRYYGELALDWLARRRAWRRL